jgi:hypothetical protein
MRNAGRWGKISCLLVVIFLGAISDVRSQDLFREMDDLKKEISDVKGELSDLRNLVFQLREALLKSVTTLTPQPPEKVPPKEEKATKPGTAPDDKELTRVICKAIGQFFSEAEIALQASDSGAADTKMDEAFRKLTASLKGYERTHRVSKLLDIYQGVAWDTYVAVASRGSVQGNQQFLEYLRKHKQKFIETCPRD